jgi:signal transduction histidine kinase
MDKMRVQQVLLNLISNASKFSRSGDKIDVIASYEIIDNETLKISIRVVDYGIGMN